MWCSGQNDIFNSLFWSGPLDFPDASRQQSALDALIAAEVILHK